MVGVAAAPRRPGRDRAVDVATPRARGAAAAAPRAPTPRARAHPFAPLLPASNASTTASAARSAASVTARSSSRDEVSFSTSGTPSGVASAGSRVGGSVGGGRSAKDSVAAAVMRAVLPTPASPTTATATGRARAGGVAIAACVSAARRGRAGGRAGRVARRGGRAECGAAPRRARAHSLPARPTPFKARPRCWPPAPVSAGSRAGSGEGACVPARAPPLAGALADGDGRRLGRRPAPLAPHLGAKYVARRPRAGRAGAAPPWPRNAPRRPTNAPPISQARPPGPRPARRASPQLLPAVTPWRSRRG